MGLTSWVRSPCLNPPPPKGYAARFSSASAAASSWAAAASSSLATRGSSVSGGRLASRQVTRLAFGFGSGGSSGRDSVSPRGGSESGGDTTLDGAGERESEGRLPAVLGGTQEASGDHASANFGRFSKEESNLGRHASGERGGPEELPRKDEGKGGAEDSRQRASSFGVSAFGSYT